MTHLDLKRINLAIANRSNVFYWQTDRAIEPEEAGSIWADRHRYFTDNELLEQANAVLGEDKLSLIEPLDLDAQTNLGNVNSVRIGKLDTGKEVIIRSHPRGIINGYFHVESTAARLALEAGLPTYKTLAVHDYEGSNDFAFQIIEKLPGTAIKKLLETNPEYEVTIVPQIGKMMARLHQIKVEGFGPFDNTKAKDGELVGLHKTLGEAVRAGLPFNISVLCEKGILTDDQSVVVTQLFNDDNPLLATSQAVLVHNDFADWNLLTDGKDVTAILDWDECVASDPVSDIACWSTFFDPERMSGFLDGYWQVVDKPEDFQDKFELLRLRYVLSKMTLRLRRYIWSPTDEIRDKIEVGKIHLAQSLKHFGL